MWTSRVGGPHEMVAELSDDVAMHHQTIDVLGDNLLVILNSI